MEKSPPSISMAASKDDWTALTAVESDKNCLISVHDNLIVASDFFVLYLTSIPIILRLCKEWKNWWSLRESNPRWHYATGYEPDPDDQPLENDQLIHPHTQSVLSSNSARMFFEKFIHIKHRIKFVGVRMPTINKLKDVVH